MLEQCYWILEGDKPASAISPFDRGIAYGDGLFETMRVVDGLIPLRGLHCDRLAQGLHRLDINVNWSSLNQLIDNCCVSQPSAVFKLVVTRGVAARGYLPPSNSVPTVIASLHALNDLDSPYTTQGIGLGVSSIRLGKNASLAGLKHLNRLEQVLVRQDLHKAGFVEGVVLDCDELVIEGAFSNIFAVSGNILMTPSLQFSGVAGIMRQWLIALAQKQGREVQECKLTLQDLLNVDELFLCNSVYGIWPVTSLGGKHWQPGPLTRSFQQEVEVLFGSR